MRGHIGIILFFLFAAPAAQAGWFCTEGASERISNDILACGIATAKDEDEARKAALRNAFDELDLVCDRSADCRNFELNIEPKRNECVKEADGYKCYRAVMAKITNERRGDEFRKGETLKSQMTALDEAHAIARELHRLNQEPDARKGCEVDTTLVEEALADLSDPSRVDAMVKQAVKIPFAGECAAIHYRILEKLRYYKLPNERYENFLLLTIAEGEDTRPLVPVVRYFSALGPLGSRWPVVFGAMRNADKDHYVLWKSIFENKQEAREELNERLDQLLDAAFEGEVGRPVPMEFDTAFLTILKLNSSWITLRACEHGFHRLSRTADFLPLHNGLFDRYKYAETDDARRGLVKWMAANVNRAEPTAAMGEALVSTFKWFHSEIKKLDDEEEAERIAIQRYRDDMDTFKRLAAENLEVALGLVKDDRWVEQRVVFCLENGIACKGIVPTTKELKSRLGSKHQKKRVGALDILRLMPETAKQLEDEIVQNVLDANDRKRRFGTTLLRSAVNTLLEIPEISPHALRVVTQVTVEGRMGSPLRDRVLQKFGTRLVRPAMDVIADQTNPAHVRREACELLGFLGPQAKEAVPLIEAEMKKAGSPVARSKLEVSLNRIKGSP